MTKTIEALLNGTFDPIEFLGKNNPELKKLENIMFRDLENLEKSLNENQKEIYKNYIVSVNKYISASSKQSFYDGFCIGTKLTTESLLNAEQLLQSNLTVDLI